MQHPCDVSAPHSLPIQWTPHNTDTQRTMMSIWHRNVTRVTLIIPIARQGTSARALIYAHFHEFGKQRMGSLDMELVLVDPKAL